jgi:hypothetical protein
MTGLKKIGGLKKNKKRGSAAALPLRKIKV